MPYPNKPTGNYQLRNYDFASNDTKKLPMDEYLFKSGYKNAEESKVEAVPDAHEQNWLFDLFHRNIKYNQEVAEENKKQLAEKVATPTSIGQVKIGYGLEVTSNGTVSVMKDIAQDANIISYDLPVGSYMLWAGNNTPEYFIEPKGQELLRATYVDLWNFAQSNNLVADDNNYVSGKLFGPGDGSTTFKVFDIRGKFLKVANDDIPVGTYEEAGLPDHSHTVVAARNGIRYVDYDDGSGLQVGNTTFETGLASASNSIYGKSETVTPENYALKLILKALPTPPSNAVPTGTILDYTANSAPDGYIMANGAELSRITFAKLFSWVVSNGLLIEQSQIPTTAHGFYGTGDGSTTFTIPDLRGVHKRGSDLASNRGGASLGSYLPDGLPNITGTLNFAGGGSVNIATGAFKGDLPASTHTHSNTVIGANGFTFDASRSSDIYGKANQVQPKSVAVNYIIKY